MSRVVHQLGWSHVPKEIFVRSQLKGIFAIFTECMCFPSDFIGFYRFLWISRSGVVNELGWSPAFEETCRLIDSSDLVAGLLAGWLAAG